MSNPQIDTRAAIERAFEDFDVFLDMGILVNSMFPSDGGERTVSALQLVKDEFNNTLRPSVLDA